jgi:hypothetical protein
MVSNKTVTVSKMVIRKKACYCIGYCCQPPKTISGPHTIVEAGKCPGCKSAKTLPVESIKCKMCSGFGRLDLPGVIVVQPTWHIVTCLWCMLPILLPLMIADVLGSCFQSEAEKKEAEKKGTESFTCLICGELFTCTGYKIKGSSTDGMECPICNATGIEAPKQQQMK